MALVPDEPAAFNGAQADVNRLRKIAAEMRAIPSHLKAFGPAERWRVAGELLADALDHGAFDGTKAEHVGFRLWARAFRGEFPGAGADIWGAGVFKEAVPRLLPDVDADALQTDAPYGKLADVIEEAARQVDDRPTESGGAQVQRTALTDEERAEWEAILSDIDREKLRACVANVVRLIAEGVAGDLVYREVRALLQGDKPSTEVDRATWMQRWYTAVQRLGADSELAFWLSRLLKLLGDLAAHVRDRGYDARQHLGTLRECSAHVWPEAEQRSAAPMPPAESPAGPSNRAADVPDARGYVESPADPTAYVPASKILNEYTPAELNVTARELPKLLGDYSANHIRWTRPPGKDGTPRRNRLAVHLVDWNAYVNGRRGTEPDGWPRTTANERTDRANAIRQTKIAGK